MNARLGWTLACALSAALPAQGSAKAAGLTKPHKREKAARPTARTYALIIANNKSTDPGTAPLHYADDDGAKYYELFSQVADRVELLTVLDADTQRIFPQVAAASRAPTRRELDSTLESIFADIRRAASAGLRTTLYFIYVGHGTVGEDGEGTMHLVDGRFTRSNLFQQVIAKSPAAVNHVVIDACNAYLMVARRGRDRGLSESAIDSAVQGFLGREGLEHYPNTGVLVSTSQAAEVHEWSRYEGGIFSHEVRSGMLGAADVDGDGKVTYAEMRAFLTAANSRVSDPKARLAAFAVPPAINRTEPLFNRKRAHRAPTLHIPGPLAARYYLEDSRGVRYADLNVSQDGPVTLMLVPSATYFLRSDGDERTLVLNGRVTNDFDASRLSRSSSEIASRGSEALTFQRDLFAVPFGRSYYEGFTASGALDVPVPRVSMDVAPDAPMPAHRYFAIGAGAGALASLTAAVIFGVDASNKARDYRDAIDPNQAASLASGSRSSSHLSNVFYGVSAALGVGAAALWFLPSDD